MSARVRRYRLIHSRSAGGYTEFSAPSDKEAIEHAQRGLYGAQIVSLHEIAHRAGGDIMRRVDLPDSSR